MPKEVQMQAENPPVSREGRVDKNNNLCHEWVVAVTALSFLWF